MDVVFGLEGLDGEVIIVIGIGGIVCRNVNVVDLFGVCIK